MSIRVYKCWFCRNSRFSRFFQSGRVQKSRSAPATGSPLLIFAAPATFIGASPKLGDLLGELTASSNGAIGGKCRKQLGCQRRLEREFRHHQGQTWRVILQCLTQTLWLSNKCQYSNQTGWKMLENGPWSGDWLKFIGVHQEKATYQWPTV